MNKCDFKNATLKEAMLLIMTVEVSKNAKLFVFLLLPLLLPPLLEIVKNDLSRLATGSRLLILYCNLICNCIIYIIAQVTQTI